MFAHDDTMASNTYTNSIISTTPAFCAAAPVAGSASLARPAAGACSLVAPRRAFATRAKRVAVRMMADDEGADDVDDAPSDTYVPASEGNDATGSESTEAVTKRASLSARLLQLAAVTSRGLTATAGQAANVDDLVQQLEGLNPNASPVDTDLIDGYWTLVYASPPAANAANIKRLLQPVLQFGQVRQRVSLADGSVNTEVDVLAFPAVSATVRATARATPVGGERVEIVVEKSTVTAGKLLGQLDLGGLSVDIPVEQILSRVRNLSPETYFDTFYLDENLRISRSKSSQLFIYTRLD